MCKKKLLFLLALFLLMAPARLLAYTDGQIVTFDQKIYKVISANDFTLCFLGVSGSVGTDLVIPDIVSDGVDTKFVVTEVGGSESYKCNGVTSVTIPETVTKLNSACFNGAALESINIPKSVLTISHTANYTWTNAPKYTVDSDNPNFCSDADGVLYTKAMDELCAVPSGVTLDNGAYTVKESVTKIWYDAFLRNKDLKKIVLPKNLAEIELGFPTIAYGCNNLEEYEVAGGGSTTFKAIDGVLFDDNTLVAYPEGKKTTNYQVPGGITEIAKNAISGNSHMQAIDLNEVTKLNTSSIIGEYNLTTVTLPKHLIADDDLDGAIADCTSISAYVVPDDCDNFVGVDGVVFSKDTTTLYFYPPNKPGETYKIPESVTKVARYAFRRAKWLTSMEIPATVSELGQQAFRECSALETVTFAEPATIQTFDKGVFMSCAKLKEVTLPTSLTTLADVFYNCSALEVVNVPDGSQLTEIQGSAFVSNTALREFNFLGSCELKTIGTNAFANLTQLQSFDFPKSVTNIGANAFSGCSSMATATFADDAVITKIGEGAFADCGLTAITIPESVRRIEKEAFRNCDVLTEVNLSANVNYVSPEAFKHCWNLDNITVDKDNTVYSSIDGYLLTADKETLVLFPPGKANNKFTLLPPSITTIGEYAFYDCSKLENVIIPNKVTSIGKRAFGLCSNLNTITFLSDAVIDPANIDQGENTMSFDDDRNDAPNMFKNINTYVRKELQSGFQTLEFYKQFKIVGTSFYEDDVEYLPVSDNSVSLLSSTNKRYTFVVPTKTTATNADGQAYNVALIGDYAFQNTPSDMHEVVVKTNVEYIGGKAFMTDIANNTSTIEKVFFIESAPTKRMLSTTRFELDETGNNYNEFAATTNVYVKKSALDTYKEAWTKTVYNRGTKTYEASPFDFTSQIDYRIPDVTIAAKYTTFAREFDTDFSDYFATNGNSDVAAFVAGNELRKGTGDWGTTQYNVQMTSVDENGGYSSYAYVPANTGVLLKVLDQNTTSAGFYYTIGEHDSQTYNVTNNIMTGVTEDYQRVEASAADPVYVIQGGIFRQATAPIERFAVHRAYMKIAGLPAGAKLMLDFGDGPATAIDTVMGSETTADDAYYNLNGQRVEQPRRGVYIYKGKKTVIK